MTSAGSYLNLIPTTDVVIRLIICSPTIFTKSVPWPAVLARMPPAFLVDDALKRQRFVRFGGMLLRQALPCRLWISFTCHWNSEMANVSSGSRAALRRRGKRPFG